MKQNVGKIKDRFQRQKTNVHVDQGLSDQPLPYYYKPVINNILLNSALMKVLQTLQSRCPLKYIDFKF